MAAELNEQDVQAWRGLVEVDRLTVLAIVDNETDGLSSPCLACDPAQPGWSGGMAYTSEFSRLTQAFLEGKMEEIDFRKVVHAGHGLSLLLVAERDGTSHTLLLDAGPEPALWSSNAARLGVKVEQLEAVVLSHWHPDHSAGLSAVAELASLGRAPPESPVTGSIAAETTAPGDVVFDLHPDRPIRRGFQMPDGTRVPFNPDVSLEALSLPGCRVELHAEAHTLLDGFFFVSGAIPRVTPYETGMPNHITQRDWAAGEPAADVEGEMWARDPLVMDERFVAVRVKGRGAVVFSSCSHAGIVSVARHAVALDAATGGHQQLLAAVGGFHLSGRDCEGRVAETVQDLTALLEVADGVVLAGHCTGWRAKAALATSLPDGHFQTLVVGGQYKFIGTQ